MAERWVTPKAGEIVGPDWQFCAIDGEPWRSVDKLIGHRVHVLETDFFRRPPNTLEERVFAMLNGNSNGNGC